MQYIGSEAFSYMKLSSYFVPQMYARSWFSHDTLSKSIHSKILPG